MKIKRAILLIVGFTVVLNLQSGCNKSKERTQQPSPIKPTETLNNVPETTPQQKGKLPALKVENPVCDIGTVGPNKANHCTFKFKNEGEGTLHIEKVLTPCQCTQAKLDKLDYEPGESGSIAITYTSSSYEAAVKKFAHIVSNDPTNSRFELTIQGKVEYKVQVEPNPMNLFLNQENAGAGDITLKSKDGKAFSIRSFTATNETITAEFDPTLEQSEFVLKPKVNVDNLRANLTGSIKIRLTHPDTNQITLTFKSLPLYLVSPPRFAILDLQADKVIERQLWIKSNYQDKVEIESITSMRGYMEVYKQEEQGNSVKLYVKITPPAQDGKTRRHLSDKLTIKMADGEELPVTLSGWYSLTPSP